MMSEFRAALQRLVSANEYEIEDEEDVGEIDEAQQRLCLEIESAKALLARPEPEPRITREEAEALLERYALASASHYLPHPDEAAAREACLSAMLRVEPAPSAPPEPQTQALYVFLQQRPRDKQPFPLVYVDQQLAAAAPHRVTPVVAVDVPMLPSPPAASDGEKA